MRKRTLIELLLLLPLLLVGIQVWQRTLNRPAVADEPPETEDAAPHRVQDLMRRTPSAFPEPEETPPPRSESPPPQAAPLPAWITLQVLEADGTIPTDAVLVFSPDETLYESAPLGQLVLSADPGILTLQASATDGASLRISDPQTLRLEPGERHTLQIRLPAPEPLQALPGFSLLPGDTYALITEVSPGSPAEAAGLQPGDAVLALDGVPTANLSVAQLEDLLLGPAETPLRLSLILQHDNGEFEEVEALITRVPLP